MKGEQKIQAIALREAGFSLLDIAKKLNVAKSSASLWVRGVDLSEKQRLHLYKRTEIGRQKAAETNRKKRIKKVEAILLEVEPIVQDLKITREFAKIYCALLYWCEGSKDKGSVTFVNSDPVLIATYLSLFRKAFTIDESKFRICLHLHEYHDANKQKLFWSQVTRIPESRFLKIYNKKNSGIYKKEGYPGCVSIRYHDVRIAIELRLLWELFGKHMGA